MNILSLIGNATLKHGKRVPAQRVRSKHTEIPRLRARIKRSRVH